MTDQDRTVCMICGNKLDHTPKLGDVIAHTLCWKTSRGLIVEAEARAARMTKTRVEQGINAHIEKVYELTNDQYTRGMIEGLYIARKIVRFWGEDSHV